MEPRKWRGGKITEGREPRVKRGGRIESNTCQGFIQDYGRGREREQDGSRMIVVCESTLIHTHLLASQPLCMKS